MDLRVILPSLIAPRWGGLGWLLDRTNPRWVVAPRSSHVSSSLPRPTSRDAKSFQAVGGLTQGRLRGARPCAQLLSIPETAGRDRSLADELLSLSRSSLVLRCQLTHRISHPLPQFPLAPAPPLP